MENWESNNKIYLKDVPLGAIIIAPLCYLVVVNKKSGMNSGITCICLWQLDNKLSDKSLDIETHDYDASFVWKDSVKVIYPSKSSIEQLQLEVSLDESR